MVQKDKHKIMAIWISILLSIVLWIFVMGEKNPVQTRVVDNVKVSIENADNISRSNLVLLPNQDLTISVSIKGRVKDLLAAKSEDFKLEADMSGYLKKGENDIPVTVKSLPNGVEVSESDIPKVKVKLDSLSTRFVPVNVVVKGSAKSGYEHIKPTTDPTGVMISGPKSYVDEVSKVVGSVDIGQVEGKVTKTIPVEPVNSEDSVVTNVSIEPKFVDVTVDIAPSKDVPVVVKTTGELPSGLVLDEINSKVKTVKIIGSQKDINRVKAIETESFDLSNIKETVTKEIKLILPLGISTQSDIKSVGVEFKVNKNAEKEFKVPINITGRLDEYTYELDRSEVNVKVRSTQSILNSLNEKNISAIIDASEMKEGENKVEVKVSLEGQGEVLSIEPKNILVKVNKKLVEVRE